MHSDSFTDETRRDGDGRGEGEDGSGRGGSGGRWPTILPIVVCLGIFSGSAIYGINQFARHAPTPEPAAKRASVPTPAALPVGNTAEKVTDEMAATMYFKNMRFACVSGGSGGEDCFAYQMVNHQVIDPFYVPNSVARGRPTLDVKLDH